MIIKSTQFVTSAVTPENYPEQGFPEIAFAGRSNVGKSSLINTLLDRKRLVKTSSTPGRTQLINFFAVNEQLSLVDLPGYGYARVPPSVQRRWGPMVETYLRSRQTLAAVVVIMDIRRVPRQEEFDLISWLQAFDIHQITVLTKSDKLSKARRTLQRRQIAAKLGASEASLILFSAKSRLGRDLLWEAIEKRLSAVDAPPA